MSDSAYRILVVVLLIMILIGVVADVAMQLVGVRNHGGRGGFMQFGPGGRGESGDQNRGPQRDQGQGWLPGFELSAA